MKLARRGLWIIALGYALNAILFFQGNNWRDLFAVDVLHTIGLGMIASIPVAYFLSTPLAFGLAIAWFALSVNGGQLAFPDVLGGWINGTDGIGYFPILPWLGYIWVGVGVGKLMWRSVQAERDYAKWLLLVGAVALLLVFVVPNVGYRHPRLPFTGLSIAVVCLLWAGLVRLEAISMLGPLLLRPFALMGRASLMLYVFHHLTGYRLPVLLGWVTPRVTLEANGTFDMVSAYGGLSAQEAVITLAVMIGLCLAAAAYWPVLRQSLQARAAPLMMNRRSPRPNIAS